MSFDCVVLKWIVIIIKFLREKKKFKYERKKIIMWMINKFYIIWCFKRLIKLKCRVDRNKLIMFDL